MTNIPPEITKAPDGYEWTGDVRLSVEGEAGAGFEDGKWKVYDGPSSIRVPILRKIKPETVMVELPRSTFNYIKDASVEQGDHTGPMKLTLTGNPAFELRRACREAEEADAE